MKASGCGAADPHPVPGSEKGGKNMFDAGKKAKATEAVEALCFNCKPEEHSNDCPLVKAMAAVGALPTA